MARTCARRRPNTCYHISAHISAAIGPRAMRFRPPFFFSLPLSHGTVERHFELCLESCLCASIRFLSCLPPDTIEMEDEYDIATIMCLNLDTVSISWFWPGHEITREHVDNLVGVSPDVMRRVMNHPQWVIFLRVARMRELLDGSLEIRQEIRKEYGQIAIEEIWIPIQPFQVMPYVLYNFRNLSFRERRSRHGRAPTGSTESDVGCLPFALVGVCPELEPWREEIAEDGTMLDISLFIRRMEQSSFGPYRVIFRKSGNSGDPLKFFHSVDRVPSSRFLHTPSRTHAIGVAIDSTGPRISCALQGLSGAAMTAEN